MKNIMILLILTLMSVSCSTKYLPVSTSEVSISEDFAIVKQQDLTFAIENKLWVREPQNLTDYFTTFYVSIRNNSTKPIEIGLKDIVLLDMAGNQYDMVDLGYIESFLLPKQIEYLIISQIEDTNSLTADRQQFLKEQQDTLEKWRESKRNLITYSFHTGMLHPGAQKSGFIYFPKLDPQNREIQIFFRDKKIDFIRSDVKRKLKQ